MKTITYTFDYAYRPDGSLKDGFNRTWYNEKGEQINKDYYTPETSEERFEIIKSMK